MTPLRERMIRAMHMHGFSPRTHESYLAAVTGLARFSRRSPDTLSKADLARYFDGSSSHGTGAWPYNNMK